MRQASPRKNRQRGAALIALAAVLVLGMGWMMVSAISSATGRNAAQVDHNARVLAEAKAALIAYVATSALESGEDNPGRLPCPQAWGDVGTTNEGRAAGNCAATAAGWLPWRTLGLPKMLDASGRQLWYVISPGWHLPTAGATLTINSYTAGQLSLDGLPTVALIVAPGSPLSIAPNTAQQAAGCIARNQSQALAFPTAPNVLDFLECQNGSTADNVFTSSVVDNGSNPVFNDQVLAITTADILPALEAAIAKRIEREIVPALKSVYEGSAWGLSTGARVFPYAAPFANPGPGSSTSSYVGTYVASPAGTYQGLLPFSLSNCTASAAEPRCQPGAALHSWATTPTAYDAGGWGYIQTQSCSYETGNVARVCVGEYHQNDSFPTNPGMRIEMQVRLNNVAMALRVLDTTRMTVEAKDDSSSGPWLAQAVTHTAVMNTDGSVTITFGATLPTINTMGWGTYADYRIRVERLVISEHSLLNANSTGVGATGWFVRNGWFRLLYYAVAQTHTAAYAPAPACTTSNCLALRIWPDTTIVRDKRAVLVLAGRANSDQTRPSTDPLQYVEFGNGDGGTVYDQYPARTAVNATLNSPFNDRVVVVDAN